MITVHVPRGLIVKNFTVYPHTVGMHFIWSSQWTQISSTHSIKG